MFFDCRNLETLILPDLSNCVLTSLADVFGSCGKLKSLDLSTLHTDNVSNMSYLFSQCSSLEFLDIRNFTFTNVSSSNSMFSGVPANCLIIVKSDTEKTWITSKWSGLTNVKTVAEYEG